MAGGARYLARIPKADTLLFAPDSSARRWSEVPFQVGRDAAEVGQLLLEGCNGGVLALEEVRIARGVALPGGEVVLGHLELAADGLELAAQRAAAGAVVIVGKDGKAAWKKVYDIADQSDPRSLFCCSKPAII